MEAPPGADLRDLSAVEADETTLSKPSPRAEKTAVPRCPNDPTHGLLSRRIEEIATRIRWANNTPWCPTCDVDAVR